MQYSRTFNGGAEAAAAKHSSVMGSRWAVAAFIIVSLTLVCLTGRDGLIDLHRRWAYEEEYGYGFLAAALVPFFLWRRWHLVRMLSTDTKWPGLALLIVAQVCAVLGTLGESYFIEQIGFVLTLLGIMVLIFGVGPIRIFAPLTVLLLLTIPLPYTLQAIVTVKLQLLSTNIGVAVIRLIGIPVFVDGNIIDLGHYKLQVAEACSGLRYLLPLTCISFILAYLYQAPLWKRAIVVASALPITILINSFRIAVIAVLVDNFGSQMAEGFLHQFEGWVIFLFGGLLLALEILALEGFRLAKINLESILLLDSRTPSAVGERLSLTGSALVAVFVCAAALGLASSITWAYELRPPVAREMFMNFPHQIGDWSAHEAQLDPEVLAALNATDTYLADFSQAGDKAAVNLFVAYYDSLSKGAAIHSPRVCLPGSGWEFASFEEKDFGELSPESPGTFNRVIVQKGEQKILMYYWFQQRERQTANEFSMKYYLLVDGLKKSRKDGALIRVFTPILTGGEKGMIEADNRLRAFSKAVFPKMSSFIPR